MKKFWRLLTLLLVVIPIIILRMGVNKLFKTNSPFSNNLTFVNKVKADVPASGGENYSEPGGGNCGCGCGGASAAGNCGSGSNTGSCGSDTANGSCDSCGSCGEGSAGSGEGGDSGEK